MGLADSHGSVACRTARAAEKAGMSASPVARPDLATILPDVAAFAAGLIAARMLGWNTTDLVWSLWLSSLTLGYLSILFAIGKGFYLGSAVVFSDGFPDQYRAKAVLGGSLVGLFVLAFFSVHFCAFHAVHAGFLSSFFPPNGVPKQVFSSVSFNPIRLLGHAVSYLMPKYGFFLVPIIISERRALFGSLGALLDARREFGSDQYVERLFKASGASTHDLFSRPYVNVVRMHVLIFFFAICHALKVDSFAIYVVVYAVYFFPWSIFRKPDGNPRQNPATG
jgi:Family of unknown function (DUF6498)